MLPVVVIPSSSAQLFTLPWWAKLEVYLWFQGLWHQRHLGDVPGVGWCQWEVMCFCLVKNGNVSFQFGSLVPGKGPRAGCEKCIQVAGAFGPWRTIGTEREWDMHWPVRYLWNSHSRVNNTPSNTHTQNLSFPLSQPSTNKYFIVISCLIVFCVS